MSQDTEPDEGVNFYEADSIGGVIVEAEPTDPTGDQNETDDAAPETSDNKEADTTSEITSDTEEVEEVAETEVEPKVEVTEDDQLKKAQHAIRVEAFKNRELKRKLKELESQAEPPSQAPNSGNSNSDNKPKVPRMSDPDIEYDEDIYTDKMEKYQEQSAAFYLQKQQRKLEQDQIRKETEKTVDSFVEQSTTLQASNSEYSDLVNASAGAQFSDVVREAIVGSEQGALLHYEILKDPERFESINRMPPMQAMREIVKIEAGISGAPKVPAKKKTVTTAPKPVDVAKGAASQSSSAPKGFKFDY
tara:strand:+ start:3950 stop:4861 length:912 start_codon:yes stop_codon:yes gene_type:complete